MSNRVNDNLQHTYGSSIRTKRYPEAASDLKNKEPLSEKRTGYQTSEHFIEQSCSALDKRALVSDLTFEDEVNNCLSTRSPVNNPEDRQMQMHKFTRKHHCARTIHDLEQKCKMLNSNFARTPKSVMEI